LNNDQRDDDIITFSQREYNVNTNQSPINSPVPIKVIERKQIQPK